MKKRKTILSLILTVAMMLSTIPPVTVFAASDYTVSLSASAERVDSGESVGISIDVTSASAATYNAFYAVLNYDSGKFTYSGEDSVNGFSVDNSTAGKLKISKTGSDIAIREGSDLTLSFTAKAGGKGSFSLAGAKVDVAANAEKDAPEAVIGAPVSVVNTALSSVYMVSVSAPEQVTVGEDVEIKFNVTNPYKNSYNYFYVVLKCPDHILSYTGENTVDGYSLSYNDRIKAYVIQYSGDYKTIQSDGDELTLYFKATQKGSGSFSITNAKIDDLSNDGQEAASAERGESVEICVVAKKDLSILTKAEGKYFFSLYVNDVLLGENLVPGSIYENVAAAGDVVRLVTHAIQSGYGVGKPVVYQVDPTTG